ncbi:DUF2752 domain-containing protein [Allonocardiopsis opalescens]|uniref:DUF2752 domain-containing protein n=1 Tax=Allonocardiopsis opalescens TaxID=1144618 RepID=UPI001FE91347|nr:DUF2752 domain-containing protein [Allonocardiopsis opalescens]
MLAAGAAAVATVAVVDPNEPGHYPTCPFLALTGLYCPGCGTLRATNLLVHGDLAGAVDMNVLFVLALPLLAFWWGRWALRTVRERPRASLAHPAWMWATFALINGYWILRNLPIPLGAWLAPGA